MAVLGKPVHHDPKAIEPIRIGEALHKMHCYVGSRLRRDGKGL